MAARPLDPWTDGLENGALELKEYGIDELGDDRTSMRGRPCPDCLAPLRKRGQTVCKPSGPFLDLCGLALDPELLEIPDEADEKLGQVAR